jgi:hypothetical protein
METPTQVEYDTAVRDAIADDQRLLYEVPFFARMYNYMAVKALGSDIYDFPATRYAITLAFGFATKPVGKQVVTTKLSTTEVYFVPFGTGLHRITNIDIPTNAKVIEVSFLGENGAEAAFDIDRNDPDQWLNVIMQNVRQHWPELNRGFTGKSEQEIQENLASSGQKKDQRQAGTESSTVEQIAEEERRVRQQQEELERRKKERDRERRAQEAREEEEVRLANEARRAYEELERQKKEQEEIDREQAEREYLEEQELLRQEEARLEEERSREIAKGQQPQPVPSSTRKFVAPDGSVAALRRLIVLLQGTPMEQIKATNTGLMRLLASFNAIYCFEITPFPNEIEPIYLNAPTACRVRRLFVQYNGVIAATVTYAKDQTTKDIPVLSAEFRRYVTDSLTAEVDVRHMTGQTKFRTYYYAYDYSQINPLFGRIQLIYPTLYDTPDSTKDTNGLYRVLGLGDEGWQAEAKYVLAGTADFVAKDIAVHEPNADLNDAERAVLSQLLFSSADDRAAIKNLLAGTKLQWNDTFPSLVSTRLEHFKSAMRKLQLSNREVFDVVNNTGSESAIVRQLHEKLSDAEARLREQGVTSSARMTQLQDGLDRANETIAQLELSLKGLGGIDKELAELRHKVARSEINAQYYEKLVESLAVLFRFEGSGLDFADDYLALFELKTTIGDDMIAANTVKEENLRRLEMARLFESSAKLRQGLDVSVMKKDYSTTIRSNLFKGPYSVDLTVLAASPVTTTSASQNEQQQVMDMTFRHINTFKSGPSRAFYGAAFDSVAPQQYRKTLDTKLAKNIIPSSGQLRIQVRDEKNQVVKSLAVPFDINLRDQTGYLYLLETSEVKLFVKPIDATHMKLTMLAVDV